MPWVNGKYYSDDAPEWVKNLERPCGKGVCLLQQQNKQKHHCKITCTLLLQIVAKNVDEFGI
jgi:hypothetical protein